MDGWALATTSATSIWCSSHDASGLTTASAARYLQVFTAFQRYSDALGVSGPAQVAHAHCDRFLYAPLRTGGTVSPSTARLRLTVIRSAFQAMESDGLVQSNPTALLRVSFTPGLYAPCPLTPPETARLLVAGRTVPSDTLRPATVALALTGASHGEVANTVRADLHLQQAVVDFRNPFGARTSPLGPEAIRLLESRVVDIGRISRRRRELGDPSRMPISLSRSPDDYPLNSLASIVSGNLTRALLRAGVTRNGVRPKSIREYAANACYAEAGRIEAVAELLGLRSLDATARMIDQDWQSRWGPVIRKGNDA